MDNHIRIEISEDDLNFYWRYAGPPTTINIMHPSSEPVRVGDTIKALLAGWKFDRIEP